MKDKKKILIGGVAVVAILLVAVIGFVISNSNNNGKYVAKNNKVEQETVDKLYDVIKANECTIADLNKENKDEEALLYSLFSKLAKEDMLTDSISITDYQEIAKEILGAETSIYPENYQYDTYVYTKSGDTITREQVKCDSNTKYVSKLYGYSYGVDTLLVHVKVGYISENKVYDLEDKYLGEYTEDTLNKLLDDATMQEYNYIKENGNYYLDNVK